MKTRNIIAIISLVIILGFGLFAVIFGKFNIPVTYDGSDIDVLDIYNNPSVEAGKNDDADGVASIIVQQNIAKTMAANNVAAIVFDFRGYDTLGESFILLTAIAGSFVILAGNKKAKKEDAQS